MPGQLEYNTLSTSFTVETPGLPALGQAVAFNDTNRLLLQTAIPPVSGVDEPGLLVMSEARYSCVLGEKPLAVSVPAIALSVSIVVGESQIHEDEQGKLHVDGHRDILLNPGFNGSVYVGDVDLMQMAKNFETLWKLSPFRPRLDAVGGWKTFDTVEAFDGVTWTKAPPMPTARGLLGVTVFNNKLYAIGGGNGNTIFSTVETFDGISWSSAPPMPTARRNIAVAVFRNKIFAVGGFFDLRNLATVETFDGLSWSPAPPMPTARNSLGAVVFKDQLLAIGGSGSWPNGLDTVEVFNGASWVSAPPMPTARLGVGVAVFDDKIFAVGGHDGGSNLNIVEIFDGDSCSTAPPMSTARFWLGAAVFDNKIVAVGGSSGGRIATVEVFDGISWSPAPPMPTAREALGFAVFPPEQ